MIPERIATSQTSPIAHVGRRLKALQELAAEGVIPADFKVPCLVEEPAAALPR
jgi:hypothetical protein